MRALPGIKFETVPPDLAETLPRMDIAAFVGFAESGPVDVPVAVEDVARFREIFGSDPTLAWDSERNQWQNAYLGPAVEAFFQNGGQRCWIVRVADNPHLQEFELPGLIHVAGAMPSPYTVRARSPGAWAGQLRIGTTLETTPLNALALVAEQDTNRIGDELAADPNVPLQLDMLSAPGTIAQGDLVQVSFLPTDLYLFLVVDGIETIPGGLRITGLGPAGAAPADPARATQPDWHRPAGAPGWQWAIESLASPPDESRNDLSPALQLLDETVGRTAYEAWRTSPASDRLIRLQQLSFEINVWRGRHLSSRVGDLSFYPGHPRFFGNLPSDDTLFLRSFVQTRPRSDGRDPELEAFRQSVAGARAATVTANGKRFAVAGVSDVPPSISWPLYLPQAMRFTRTPPPDGGLSVSNDPSVQNGLAALDARIFFDERLEDYTGESLWRSAAQLHNAAREALWRPDARPARRLRGLHALFPVAEATVLAVPDAVHRMWNDDAPELPPMLGTPYLHPVEPPDEFGRLRVYWTAVDGATAYLLKWSESPDFTFAESERRDATPGSVNPTESRPLLAESCSRRAFFRVRAEREGEPSPWSNTREFVSPEVAFDDCNRTALPELVLETQQLSTPGLDLAWRSEVSGALAVATPDFELQTADDALFQSARTLELTPGNTTRYALSSPLTISAYFRVRATADGDVGPWSNTRFVAADAASRLSLVAPSRRRPDPHMSVLLAIHRTLLRFCSARGDMVGLLSLPRHYEAPETLDYLAAVAPNGNVTAVDHNSPRPLTLGESTALGYGALYHPWLAGLVQREGGNQFVQFSPPDGAAAGRLANTALTRGAWSSSANRALTGVLALEPDLDDDETRLLLELQVNVVRSDPRGFLLINEETLSDDSDTRPLTVRRLLILLKRLALREGNNYVFEPISSDLPDRVRNRFERLLSTIYVRGGLQGRVAAEAFRVVVDGSVNPPRSLELGRFVVELRVAPSRPLSFLRVRLVRSGPQELAVGEI